MGGGDDKVVNHAVVQIVAGADLLLVHLPDVDVSGHAAGWMSERYLQQVAEADHAIGRLLNAVPGHATVILTADHGGLGPTHGMDRAADMTIPWIIVGTRRSSRTTSCRTRSRPWTRPRRRSASWG